MEIAKGVAIIPIEIGGFILNPTLIWDESHAILIDCGFPGQSEQIRKGIEEVGIPIDGITAVILTHQDIDHIGCLPELKKELGEHITVYAHEKDKPYIEKVRKRY